MNWYKSRVAHIVETAIKNGIITLEQADAYCRMLESIPRNAIKKSEEFLEEVLYEKHQTELSSELDAE